MKISRLKLLSVVCFGLALTLTIVFYTKSYKDSKEKLAYVERTINIDDFKTAKIEEINEIVAQEEQKEEQDNTEKAEEETNSTEEVEVTETTEEEVEVVEPAIVYDGLTMEQLASKLDRTLSSTLSGKGYLYASYSLERGVDPYLAVAITMEETGCAWGCSNLVVSCNNVGGMKGSGCGSYAAFSTIDEGIMAFIDNIANNYVAYGLTTAEAMNSKYAENPMWASNVNAYIEKIKNR